MELKAADAVNPVNTVWTLIAAFLVFGMQVGFTILEAGFCQLARDRERAVDAIVKHAATGCMIDGKIFLYKGAGPTRTKAGLLPPLFANPNCLIHFRLSTFPWMSGLLP